MLAEDDSFPDAPGEEAPSSGASSAEDKAVHVAAAGDEPAHIAAAVEAPPSTVSAVTEEVQQAAQACLSAEAAEGST